MEEEKKPMSAELQIFILGIFLALGILVANGGFGWAGWVIGGYVAMCLFIHLFGVLALVLVPQDKLIEAWRKGSPRPGQFPKWIGRLITIVVAVLTYVGGFPITGILLLISTALSVFIAHVMEGMANSEGQE